MVGVRTIAGQHFVPRAGRRGYNPPVRSGYSSSLLVQEAAVQAGNQLPLLLGRAAGAAGVGE
jgi:hypothetical protein